MERVSTPLKYQTMLRLANAYGLDETYVDAWCYRFVDFSDETQTKACAFESQCILPLLQQ